MAKIKTKVASRRRGILKSLPILLALALVLSLGIVALPMVGTVEAATPTIDVSQPIQVTSNAQRQAVGCIAVDGAFDRRGLDIAEEIEGGFAGDIIPRDEADGDTKVAGHACGDLHFTNFDPVDAHGVDLLVNKGVREHAWPADPVMPANQQNQISVFGQTLHEIKRGILAAANQARFGVQQIEQDIVIMPAVGIADHDFDRTTSQSAFDLVGQESLRMYVLLR